MNCICSQEVTDLQGNFFHFISESLYVVNVTRKIRKSLQNYMHFSIGTQEIPVIPPRNFSTERMLFKAEMHHTHIGAKIFDDMKFIINRYNLRNLQQFPHQTIA